MKKLIISAAFILAASFTATAQVGVGTTTPKAALEVTSSTAGVLIPRMNTTTRTGLTVAADQNGMMVYDTTTKTFWYYEHTTTSWVEVGTGSAGKFVDGTTATDAVFTGGKVGIGTTSPTYPLEISTEGPAFDDHAILIKNHREAGAGGSFYVQRSRGTKATPTKIGDSDYLGSVHWSGYDGDTYENGAAIRAQASGAISDGVLPTSLIFHSRSLTDTDVVERMRITEDGKVGIGTTSAASKLDVDGYIKVGSSDGTVTSAANGMIRYNNLTHKFQGYANGSWVNLH